MMRRSGDAVKRGLVASLLGSINANMGMISH